MSQHQSNIQSKITDNHVSKFLTPFQLRLLQKNLQEDLLNSSRQRIQIMLLADQGKSQTVICQMLGCCPATVRYWTHIARTGMAHQWRDCPIGRPKSVNEKYLERLQELMSHSPRDYGYSFRRWTTNWLQKHLAQELGIEVSDRHMKRLLKQLGLSTLSKPKEIQTTTDKNPDNFTILIQDIKPEDTPENYQLLSITSDN